ncbi:hypothetical protein G6L37_34900 [Agrobacterium rubi]|nr:hypothetical protein [Agrobacterium rubi]NTF23758.1 hypothetical protein [Agrobacterium rubi]
MARKKREQTGRLPEGWVKADPGLWVTTQSMMARFDDGMEEELPAGTVVLLDPPREIFETLLPDDDYAVDDSVPHTNWEDNSRSYMRFQGKVGERAFEFIEPINAGNGGPFGMSNGMHYVRVGPIKPLSFPEYLPSGVSMPPFWDAERATKAVLYSGGPSGFCRDHGIGKRWLPCFRVNINETYCGYVSIDAPKLKASHYWGRKSDRSNAGSVPRKSVADFLAAAESLIFTPEPHEQYPIRESKSVRFPVSELPEEWLEQILYRERFDTDEDFRREHFRQQKERLRKEAFEKYRSLSWGEVVDALSSGKAFIEHVKYERTFNCFDDIHVYAVITHDVNRYHWIQQDKPNETYVLGFIPDDEVAELVQQANEHFNGLRDESTLRRRYPNTRDQYVLASDPRAEKSPGITSRNAIVWTLRSSGDTDWSGDPNPWWSWKGRTVTGGNWQMGLSKTVAGKWRAQHERGKDRNKLGGDDIDNHSYENYGCLFTAETFEEAFSKAREIALTEEVLHLIGGGWSFARAGVCDFSTDLLEMAALREARELGRSGDRSRQRHQPLPHRLAAVVWELKRRGSKVGWDMLDDSISGDLEAEMEEDGF